MQLLKDPELRNYIGTRKLPLGCISAFGQIMSAAILKLQCKFAGRETLPPYLPHTVSISPDECSPNCKPGIFKPVSCAEYLPAVLKWAHSYQKEYEDLMIGLYKNPKDLELYWGLHQFAWLFILSQTINSSTIEKYLSFWVDNFQDKVSDHAWRSYSISERICNWINIYEIANLASLMPKLKESIIQQAVYLSSHLEEYRDEYTNNHLVNNGRALYISGRYFNHKKLAELGSTILIEELKRRFMPDWFLNENSTHYHLLVTKNYVEALRTAYLTDDKKTAMQLELPVKEMLRACDHFINSDGDDFPLFGDISPDMPPAVFRTALHFKDPADFNTPWFARPQTEKKQEERGWQCFPNSGYYRWTGDDYAVWWHSQPDCINRSHGHNDWGSFYMSIDGEPFIIDPGRENYCFSEAIFDQRLTLAQNTVMIDGFEQALFKKRNLYLSDYLKDGADIDWAGISDNAELSIDVKGYQRLRNPVRHRRVFLIKEKAFTIDDYFNGTKKHEAIAAFHLHPSIECLQKDNSTFQMVMPKGKKIIFQFSQKYLNNVTVKRGGDVKLPGGYVSSSYGSREESVSIFFNYSFCKEAKTYYNIQIT